jgi:hypothetical protein
MEDVLKGMREVFLLMEGIMWVVVIHVKLLMLSIDKNQRP